MFPMRKALSLYPTDTFHFVPGSLVISPFGKSANAKRGIITASGAACVLSLGYVTRHNYLTNLQNPQETKPEEKEFIRRAMDHGKKYEEPAVKKFFTRFPEHSSLGDINEQYTYNAEFIHRESEETVQVGATPDLHIVGDDHCLLEIKCPYYNWLNQIDVTSHEEALAVMSDKHYIQVQTQLLVLAIEKAFIFFYIPLRDGNESDNFCLFRIDADAQYHQFLLENFLRAYNEVDNNEVSKFKTMRNEGVHNRMITHNSRERHLKFLIP